MGAACAYAVFITFLVADIAKVLLEKIWNIFPEWKIIRKFIFQFRDMRGWWRLNKVGDADHGIQLLFVIRADIHFSENPCLLLGRIAGRKWLFVMNKLFDFFNKRWIMFWKFMNHTEKMVLYWKYIQFFTIFLGYHQIMISTEPHCRPESVAILTA